MGQLTIPGTSVTYSNPLQKDQATNISPLTGKVWKPSGTDSFSFTYPNGVTGIGIGGVSTGSQGTGINSGDPQPGSYDATPPQAPPLAINQDPPVAGKGKPISVSGTSGSTGNPTTDLVRKVVGQVPSGPAFANPS
jgi:hypothetical protein